MSLLIGTMTLLVQERLEINVSPMFSGDERRRKKMDTQNKCYYATDIQEFMNYIINLQTSDPRHILSIFSILLLWN